MSPISVGVASTITTSPMMRRRWWCRWLFIAVACASRAAAISRLLASYQPTPGVEERWVAEEEFYGASGIANADPDGDDHSWWDEEDEESEEIEENKSSCQLQDDSTSNDRSKNNERKRRLHRWRRRRRNNNESNVEEPLPSSKEIAGETQNNDDKLSSQYDEEHPMRTDEWELDIRLSRLFAQEGEELFPECYTNNRGEGQAQASYNTDLRNKSRYRKRQVMTFARNGYVKVSVDDNNNNNNDRVDSTKSRNRPRVGKWRIGHSGVAFDIPVLMSATRKTSGSNSDKVMSPKMTVLHYHADIHLNKFGERPRMFRGVITRDRYVNINSSIDKCATICWYILTNFSSLALSNHCFHLLHADIHHFYLRTYFDR